MSDQRPHEWFKHPELPWETCRLCGIVRRRDDKNGANCRGYVKVGPRATAEQRERSGT